jgi:hypothetical protein
MQKNTEVMPGAPAGSLFPFDKFDNFSFTQMAASVRVKFADWV